MINSKMLARIRARRANKPTRKRIPKQAHPTNLEREYARTLIAMMSSVHSEVMAEIMPMLKGSELDVMHHDADTSPHAIIPKLNALKVEIFEKKVTAQRAGLVAQGYGLRTNKFNKVAVGDQIKAVIGVNPILTLVEPATPGILAAFTADNVALITSIPERYFSEIEGIISESVTIGRRSEAVSSLLQERFSVSESRATLIARDQISKLNGKLTETRQKELGVSRYFWRTSQDERVRETHQELEGELLSWDSPPAVGHPGEDFQCRCRAEPDLSPLLG